MSVDALAAEYAAWCTKEGYGNYHPSLFLLYYDSHLTPEQREWFKNWCERWVAATGEKL